MIFSAQYYRPPFPHQHRWHDDMQAIKAAGLNTVYLWAVWGWIEPEPGVFRWEDYDRLFAEAKAAGLGVIVNVIGEIHPFWIHREVPGSNMVDHTGRTVPSQLRLECNVGLTPGGCFDNPAVRAHMQRFLSELAARYGDAENLVAWDLWNETRWAVHAGGYVCYCEHTLREYRAWLDARHGGLEGLNAAWQRRYCSWEDVEPPRAADRPYADGIEFQTFLTWRSREHMAFRHATVKQHDERHTIVAHAMAPAAFSQRYPFEQALSRGNDWDYTEFLDGFGSSHFPSWFATTPPELGARLEASRSASAAAGKLHWVGELQGGSARSGIEVHPSVRGTTQQRWVWTAVARGAKAINFWCWRDEVFARECAGFGIAGNDGFRDERLEQMARTGALFERHAALIDAYEPDHARVGVVFDPVNYYLDFAQYGEDCVQAGGSIAGYLHTLERLQIPYEVVEARRRSRLAGCRVLLMPWPLRVEPSLAEELLAWVRDGGTLLVESEVDAYDGLGFYRYPGERPFADALGIRSLGRRTGELSTSAYTPGRPGPAGVADDVPGIPYRLGDEHGALRPQTWLEPYATDGVEVLGEGTDGALVVRRALGRGQVIAVGTFAGLAARAERSEPFERFVAQVVALGDGLPDLRCSEPDGERVQWRLGRADDERVLIVTNAGAAQTLRFDGPASMFAGASAVEELASGTTLPIAVDGLLAAIALDVAADGYAVLRWPAKSIHTPAEGR